MADTEKKLIPSQKYDLQEQESSVVRRGLEFTDDLVPDIEADERDKGTTIKDIFSSAFNIFKEVKNIQKTKIQEIQQKRRILYGDQWDDSSRKREWKKLIRFNPENAEPYYRFGNVFFEKRNLKKAIQYYSLAIEKSPNFVDALRRRGDCYYALMPIIGSGKKSFGEKALRDYESALEIERDVYLLNAMGLIHELQTNPNEALKYYTDAIECDPDYPESYHNRGRIFDRLDKKDLAIVDLEKFLSFDYWSKIEIQYAKEKLYKLRSELGIQ